MEVETMILMIMIIEVSHSFDNFRTQQALRHLCVIITWFYEVQSLEMYFSKGIINKHHRI